MAVAATMTTSPKGGFVGRKRTRPTFKPTTLRRKLCFRLHELVEAQDSPTNAEIAAACGVTPDAVSQWFQGKSCPDYDLLPRLAKVLKLRDYRDLLPSS